MQLEEYIELHKKTLDAICERDYYVDKFVAILTKNGLTFESFTDTQDAALVNKIWNRFWMELPDSKSIRVPPFFDICTLAELTPQEY